MVVTGKASPDGTLYNPESAKRSPSSARHFDTFPVRIWDTYVTSERYALWYTALEHAPGRRDRYKLPRTGFVNALQGTDLEHPHPDPLFGVDFDVGANGILFVAKDPFVNQAMTFKHNLYYVSLRTFREDPAPAPQKVSVPGLDGSANSARFSPNGKSATFLQRKDLHNVYDRACIFLIEDIGRFDRVTEVVTTTDNGVWDLQPESPAFGIDPSELYVTAESRGAKRLFKIPIVSPANESIVAIPSPITTNGAVSSFHALSPTRLLFTMSTLISSSIFAMIDLSSDSPAYMSVDPHQYPKCGDRAPHVSQIGFQGAGDYHVQAFVVKPSDFTQDKAYPMLLWVHGGPVSSWTDAWSHRWNAAFFAEQGYIVIMPNITGSTGFGQEFVEDIIGAWGGRPYQDLVNCFEYIQGNMPFVDTERAVAMGASYGGYMINWYGLRPSHARLHPATSSSAYIALATAPSAHLPD